MNKKHLIIGLSIIAVLAILTSGLTWFYRGTVDDTRKSVYNKIPLPAVLVGFDTISGKDLQLRLDTAERVLQNTGQEFTAEIKDKIVQQLVDSVILKKVASNEGVVTTQAQIDEEFNSVLKQYGGNDAEKFDTELQSTYGLNTEEFKDQIIREEVLKTNITKWFNSNKEINKTAYDKASELEKMITDGKTFEETAIEYTQDEATKDFAGDSGFVRLEDLLPEFQELAKNSELNKPFVVASRYGLHLIIVSDKNVNPETNEELYNLKQIFVKTEDFEKWFKERADKVRVTRLINLN